MKRFHPHSRGSVPSQPPLRWLVRLLRWFFLLVLSFYAVCLLALFYLKWLPPFSTTVQIQRRVEAFASSEPYTKRYNFVPLSELPLHLVRAAVATEDARFFDHSGIDWRELDALLDKAKRHGHLTRGGSTITQQLVKNLFLTTHRSLLRKALEFTLTPLAERVLTKERILELYLNVVEWGPGVYGAEAAAQFHYGIPAKRLTRDQAARLVACLPAPLERHPQEMDERAVDIIERMRDMGW